MRSRHGPRHARSTMPSLSRITAAVGAGAAGAAIAVGVLAASGSLDGSDASPASAQTLARTVTVPGTTASPGAVSGSTSNGVDYEALYAKVSGSVVEVQAKGVTEDTQSDSPFPEPPSSSEGTALGTGFVVNADGTIVTNAHVVGTSNDVSVRFAEDDPLIPAKVLGRDTSSDVAVLRIDPEQAGRRLTALALADSDQVAVGEPVLAIGNPFGLERTATAGIVSATGREIDAPNGFSISGALQTDAAINSGNSGGPLLDAECQVIGINSQILAGSSTTGSSGNVGIGFAVSSNSVRDVLPQLARGETIARPYLGIATSAPPEGTKGAVVGQVVANGPGAKGGLRQRDVIVKIADQAIAQPDDVASAIADRKPGDVVEVQVRRGSQERTLKVTLGTRPKEAQ